MSKQVVAKNAQKLGLVAYLCNPSTGKVEERQEDHEFKDSLDYTTSLGRPTYIEILSE